MNSSPSSVILASRWSVSQLYADVCGKSFVLSRVFKLVFKGTANEQRIELTTKAENYNNKTTAYEQTEFQSEALAIKVRLQ